MQQEQLKARFEQASKEELLEVLKPFEEKGRSKASWVSLRDWAHKVLDTSSDVDRVAAQVLLNAHDLLDRLEKE
jgi:hypothetical protein